MAAVVTPEDQACLDEHGYCVIKSVVDEATAASVRSLIDDLLGPEPRLLLECGGDHRGAGGEEDDVSRHRPLLGDLVALEECSAANTTSVSRLCFGPGGL